MLSTVPRTEARTDPFDKYEEYDRLGLFEIIRSDLTRWDRVSVALFKLGFYASCFYRISHYLGMRLRRDSGHMTAVTQQCTACLSLAAAALEA
jgi:hypothetical protein